MSPLVKKVVAAVAVKEAIEKVQEMRRPKPSLWSRISPVAVVAALGGALFYLNRTGKLGPIVEGVKGRVGNGTPAGTPSWESNGSTAPGSETTAPTPTTV